MLVDVNISDWISILRRLPLLEILGHLISGENECVLPKSGCLRGKSHDSEVTEWMK